MRLSAFLSLGISFWNLKNIFCSNLDMLNMRKMTHPFFHDASILVSVGVFLTHRFEAVGVFAPFLRVKNTKTPLSGALMDDLRLHVLFNSISVISGR